jgi:hypothetical protein
MLNPDVSLHPRRNKSSPIPDDQRKPTPIACVNGHESLCRIAARGLISGPKNQQF